ncbi:hypothetical protein OSTOST_24358 [Ostertagia ostertagi]
MVVPVFDSLSPLYFVGLVSQNTDFTEHFYDVAVDTNLLTRFICNVSDGEQLFYPSALEVFLITDSKKCYHFSLPSFPNQIRYGNAPRSHSGMPKDLSYPPATVSDVLKMLLYIQDSSIIDNIKDQMHGFLCMSRSDTRDVYEMWCAGGGQVIEQ